VTATVSCARADTRRNHTATHLLNWALRQVVGTGIDQAGSVVAPDRLRFDFTHGQALGAEQIERIEAMVNERVLADEPVHVNFMPLAEARKIPGVRAVFGEKYPDPVRVISVGVADPATEATEDSLIEFCGGTHLDRTSQVGLFKIVSEESVAKGVRRITAVTGHEAVATVQRLDRLLREASGLLRAAPDQVPERVAAMQQEIKDLRKKRSAPAGGGAELGSVVESAEEADGVKVMVAELPLDGPDAMRSAVDQLRQKAGGPAAVLLGSRDGDKVMLVAALSEEVVKASSVKAGDWIKEAAAVVGGGGGGKPTLAQAGGKQPERLEEALKVGREWILQRLAPSGG
jgi:alanyl-tRNA synthetase